MVSCFYFLNTLLTILSEPATAFDIAAVEVDEDNPSPSEDEGFNITCTAIGVYPEPEIKLYKVRTNNEDLESTEVESNGTTILSFQSLTGGLYSITLVSHIEHTPSNHSNSTKLELTRAVDLPPSRERLVLGSSKNRTTTARPKPNVAEHYECRLTIPNSDYLEVRRLAIQEGKFLFFR